MIIILHIDDILYFLKNYIFTIQNTDTKIIYLIPLI